MEIRLDGRTAIITGGSKGLGLATAKRLAESGANVAILARGADALQAAEREIAATARGEVKGFTCDVADGKAIAGAFKAVMGRFGRVDIVINNAGESRSGTLEQVTDEMWQEDIDQKLMAAVRFCRLVWPQMKERRWGRVINVLSIASKAPVAGNAPTGVIRAAGLSLTKILSKEGAPHNILVNALLVGKIVSDQIVRRAQAGGPSLEAMIAEVGKTVPLGRMGDPGEFANVACFLASDAASYVSGVAIPVDGGLSPVI
jgi:3-oxoacyl-[acyl-carrier protein] reductase